MPLRNIVLPALGGDTTSPRWPLPIGAKRLITRLERLAWASSFEPAVAAADSSRSKASSGKTAVRSSNHGRRLAISGSPSLTLSTRSRLWKLSESLGGRMGPITRSPVRSPTRRIWVWET